MATMNALLFKAYGTKDVVYEAQIPKPVIKKDTELLVKVKVAVVNPADLLYVAGTYAITPSSFPAQVGFEGAGVVEETGKSTAFKVGQRIHFVSLGSWAEYILIDTAQANPLHLIAIPDGLSFEIGAQLTVNPLTAYAMLDEINAKEGEFVAQNSASSTLARIIIQLAKAKGIKTINVVRRDNNTSELKALGGDFVINSESEDVVKRVLEISPGGVKYVLDAVLGKSGYQLSQTLAFGGVQLLYGLLSGTQANVDGATVIFKAASVKGFNIYAWRDSHSQEHVRQAYANIIESILNKKLVLPYKAFDGKKEPLAALTHSETPGKSEKSIIVFN